MGEIRAFITIGGSMRPLLRSGGFIYAETVPLGLLRAGDTILYEAGGQRFAHRIGKIERQGSRIFRFHVFSDSSVIGREAVLPEQVLGKVLSGPGGIPGLIWGKISNVVYNNARRIRNALRFFLISFLLSLISYSCLYAATRLKTVEWNFGIIPDSIQSGVVQAFPSISFRLPDAMNIKDAWLELDVLSENNSDLTGADIYFDQGLSATTVRDSFPASALVYSTGESLRLHFKCAIPPAVFSNAASSNDYTAAVNLSAQKGGSRFSMLALKLYVTYEYDDTSPVQVATVRFPLKSNWASSIASAQGAVAPGLMSLSYNAEIAESASPDFLVKQQWFELRGHRLSGNSTSNGTIVARIMSNGNAPAMTLNGTQICSYDFLYLTSTGTQPGFSVNTQQTLNVETTQNTVYNLGGECVLTYEFSRDAPTKTKTVYYFLGQGLSAGTAVQFPDTYVDLEEGNAGLKALYARVHGTYNGTTAGNVSWSYSVNGASGPVQVYSLCTQAAQIAGNPFFLDLSSPATNWIDGARVAVVYTPSNSANTGPMGAELTVTYQYTSASKFTDSYRTFSYQTDGGAITSNSTLFSIFTTTVESPSGRKTRNSGYLSGAFAVHRNANTLNNGSSLTQSINSLSAESLTPRVGSEAFFLTALYGDPLQLLTTANVTLNADTGINTNNIFAGGIANVTYSYFPVPDVPQALNQYRPDGSTFVTTGTWVNSTSVVIKLNMSSRIPDILTPAIEVKESGVDFDGSALITGTGATYSGSGVIIGTVTLSGLTDGTTYHWRAMLSSPNGSSSWINFGNNPETEIDFGVDLSPPQTTLSSPLNAATTNQQNITFAWAGTDYPANFNSGIAGYTLQISTDENFGTLQYSSVTANSYVTAALPQTTYYWHVRGQDTAGSTGDWSAAYSLLVDTTPPSLPVHSAPLDGDATDQLSLTFQWTPSDDSGLYGNSGVDGYELYISTVANFSVFTSSGFTQGASLARPLPKQGLYYWRARARDNVRNYSAWTTAYSVRVDTTAPPAAALVAPLTDFPTNFATINFTWSSVDDTATGNSGIRGYDLQISTAVDLTPVYYSTRTLSTAFAYTLSQQSTFYWQVRVIDNAGNASAWSSANHLQFDTSPPVPQRNILPDSQLTPPLFRASDPGNFIDIDSTDLLSGLNELRYKVTSQPDGSGVSIIPWTVLGSSPANIPSYTDDWGISWQPLEEWTTNYVHFYYSDRAGNYGVWNNIFDILKDTTPPSAPLPVSPADLSVYAFPSLTFDWSDAADLRSGTSYYQMQMSTSPDFVPVAYSAQTSDSQAAIDAIAQDFYYWRSRAFDRAGNYSQFSSTRSFRVDLSSPAMTVNAPLINGDATWRAANNALYDVDFLDVGGAALDHFEISVSTGKGRMLPVLKDWTDSGVNIQGQSSYDTDWPLPDIVWQDLLINTTNYISLRTYDLAGNASTYIDAFFIKRSSSAVKIEVGELPGADPVWRSTSTQRAYDVNFFCNDNDSLEGAQYTAYTLPNMDTGGGQQLFDWTGVPGFTPGTTYYTDDWYIGDTQFQSLVDGAANYVSVRTWNVAGTTVTSRDAFIVRKDTSPPPIPALSSPLSGSATGQMSVSFRWAAAEDLASGTTLYFIQISSSPGFGSIAFSSYTIAANMVSSPLTEATYYWQIKAKDMADNWSSYSDSWALQLDTTPPPSPALTLPLDTFTTGYMVQTFQWSPVSDDGPSGLASYTLDVSTMPSFTPVYYSSVTMNNAVAATLSLSSTYYWRAIALDRAANYSSYASSCIIVDALPPPAPLLGSPLDGFTTTAISVSFAWTGADNGPAGINDFQLLVSTDIGFSVISYSTTTILLASATDFQEGVYWWKVNSRDRAGNYSSFSATRAFIIDVSSPPATSLLSPSDDTRTNEAGIIFTWNSVDDAGPSGIRNYELYVSTDANFGVVNYSSAPAANSGTIYFTGENVFFWKVRSWDNAGNGSVFSSTYTVTVDTTPPVIANYQTGDDAWRSAASANYGVGFLDTPDLNGSGLRGAEYRVFSSSTPAGAPAGTERIPYQPIFGASLPERTTSYTVPWAIAPWSNLNQGYNFVFVRSSDMAGNSAESSSYVFYVKKDTAPPVITGNEPLPVWENGDRARNVSFSDVGSGVVIASYTVFTQPNRSGSPLIEWTTAFIIAPQNLWDSGVNINFDLLAPGTNYVSLWSADALGNGVSSTDTFRVLKDTVPPQGVTNLAVSAGAAAGSLNLQWTAPPDDTITDPSGTLVYAYRIKYKTSPFAGTDDFLASGTTFSYSPPPQAPGLTEQAAITGLVEGTTYYVGIIGIDKANNTAALIPGATGHAFATRIPPSGITDLVGLSPDSLNAGSVELVWTAVGNNASTGTAKGYVVRYATYAFSEASWNAVSDYSPAQSWNPLPAGSGEDQIIGGLTPGVTYYFAVKAFDFASPGANYSVISNTVVVQALQSGPADGILCYGQGTLQTPGYFKTTSAGSSWENAGYANNTAATIHWSVLRDCPVIRNEKILLTSSSNGALYSQRWDGPENSWNASVLKTTIASADAVYRPFDFAYEQTTGRGILAYRSGTGGQVYYEIWSSTANAWLTGALPLTVGGNGLIRWLRLEPRPGTGEIMLVTLDANNDIFAYRWNGSAWQNNTQLTLAAFTAGSQCFDVAWENTRGNCLVLWGVNRTTRYAMWSSSTSAWSVVDAQGPDIATSNNNSANWIKLAADRLSGSNNIAMSSLDSTSRWKVSVWTGASWDGPAQLSSKMIATTPRNVDIAWEKNTGKCLAVGAIFGQGNYVSYSVWSGGSWSPATAQTYSAYDLGNGASLNWLQLVPDPNSNKIVLLGANSGSAGAVSVRTLNWNGANWTGGTPLFTQGSNGAYEFFMLSLNRYDAILPTYANNQSGDDTWRSTNNGAYDVDFYDTGDSHLAKVQAQLASAGGGSDVYRAWTDELTGLNADSYTSPWSLTSSTWDQLKRGKTFISLQVFDAVGNKTALTDAFYVLKDTESPSIAGVQRSSITWYTAEPAIIASANFSDQTGLSLLSTAQYLVYPQPNMSGTKAAQGTIFGYLNQVSSSTNFGFNPGDWSLLASATNYVALRCNDAAGNSVTLVDAFTVWKDTIPPQDVTTLAAAPGPFRGTVDLSWLAPGDNGTDGNNGEGGYALSYATYPITHVSLFSAASTYAQTIVPRSPQSLETITIQNLLAGVTYYFSVRSRDKASLWADVSNSTGILPRTENVYINEISAAGTPGIDWVELYSNLPAAQSLNGWTLVYNQGGVDSPGAENTVWTGGPGDTVSSGGYFLVNALDLNSEASHHVKLKDNLGRAIDTVQWPVLSSGQNLARISDCNYDFFFEIDPTPTKGYANAITTATIKINEVDYASSQQFVEVYNTAQDTPTLAGWTLRNSSKNPFTFTRTIFPRSFTGIDFSSVDSTAKSWTDCFGAGGLNPSNDFVVLENSAGQVMDRLTWRSASAPVYFTYKASPASFNTAAAGELSAPQTLGRSPSEGADTANNSADFTAFAGPSYGSRNNNVNLAANTLNYPPQNSYLARKFKLDLTLGADCSQGSNNTLWFVRVGGAQDTKSPHIYRLKDIGFSLNTLTAQATVQVGLNFNDLDGNSLVDGTAYRLLLNTDNGSGAAPQAVAGDVTYDGSVHDIIISNIAPPFVNVGAKEGVLRIDIINQSPSPGNPVEFSSITLHFTGGSGTPLSNAEAQELFKGISVVADHQSLGTKGAYQTGIDSATVLEISSSAFSISGGAQTLAVSDPDGSAGQVVAASTRTYFVAVLMADTTSALSLDSFKVSITPGTTETVLRDGPSDIEQPLSAGSIVITSSPTVIKPAQPPAGTAYPVPVVPPGTELTGNIMLNAAADTAFVAAGDGKIYALRSDGSPKWSYDAGSAIVASHDSSGFEPNSYTYLATQSGLLYKLQDTGESVSDQVPGWQSPKNLGAAITTDIIMPNTSFLYVGTNNGAIHKINVDGSYTGGWLNNSEIAEPISGTPVIDNYSGLNEMWLVTLNGSIFRLNDVVGMVDNSAALPDAIRTSPFLIDGYLNPALNKQYIYFGGDDGYLRCRNSSNLATKPATWNDVNVNSPVHGSPYYDGNRKIFFGADNGKLYCVDYSSGDIYWTYQTGGPVRTMPIVGDNNDVYFGSDDGCLYGLDTSDGHMLPGFPVKTGGEVRSIAWDGGYAGHHPGKNYIYFGSNDGKVYSVEVP